MNERLYLGAAHDHAWPLTTHELEQAVRRRFPGTEPKHAVSAVNDMPALDFALSLADGVKHEARYSQAGVLITDDGSPQDWAEAMVWFMGLLPSDAEIFALVDDCPPERPVPAQARINPAALAAFFDSISD
jgi:hypothetical protein